jgi:sulfonate transport system substrate-binding protein
MHDFSLNRRAFAGTLLAGAIAALGLPSLAAAQDYPDVIRIGSTAPGHLKFILFRNLGLLQKEFEKEGIDVEFLTFDGGSAASVALGSGELDFMYTGNNPALRLAASGADVKAIGLSAWVPQNDTEVLVPVDSPAKTLEDLKGKRVAYLTGTVRHSIFSKALGSVGLTTADVQSFNLGIENSGPALARGDIDALVESSGVAQKLVDAGQARVLFDAGVQGKPEWSVPYIITANGAFLKRYPEVATRLLEQDIQLARWVDANPEETIRIFVEETGNSETSVRETYRDNVFYQNPEITDSAVEALKGEEAFMAANDLIKGTVDYDTWIDRSYFQAAADALVASKTN